ANFLILDAPTNHMDIMSNEILEDALCAYTGTVLYVSHDRYFINRTADRILDLNRHVLTNYLGNYDYYLEKKDEQLAKIGAVSASSRFEAGNAGQTADNTDTVSTDAKQDWKAMKEQQAAQRKRENDLKKCESEIETLEARNAEIETLMASPEICTDVAKLQELSIEKEEIEQKLTDLIEKWELLSE
ncbi:MAG: ABC transporter ATP-binding protein, partial [Lachnospiraceae bacterium]|nr:ABC transporter ATP-binding protein [Lachnospiraceae bacterium]